ncbi:MAG TPA: AMP-binding protein [Actinospica sp.]|nr:AMP-binding protein [Actinospica sp.]
MFTLFDEELDRTARRILAEHRDFDSAAPAPERLAQLRLDRLRESVRYAREHSPYYAATLAHLSRDRIAELTPESLAELPFTTKDDLRSEMFRMLAKPVSKAWIYYETTGTTGRATPCPRDNVDSLVNNTALTVCYEQIFRQHGSDHVVGVMGPTEMHATGDTFGDVCRNLGHAVVKLWPHSPVVGFRRALEVLRELSVTVVFCTPGMAMSLAKQAAELGLDPRADFSIRAFMFTGELATPELLANIGAEWGATAYNCLYASQEASVLGAVHADGRLRTIPLNVFYEVVDPDTGEPAVAEEGGPREGELVVTHLYQGSKPLIRYRTGDLVRLFPAEPGQRYPSETMVPVGRARDRIDLNGSLVTGYDLESLILAGLAGCRDYQIVIDEVDGTDRLTVQIEVDWDEQRLAARESALRDAVREAWGCVLVLERKRLGAVTTTGALVSWKAARIHDLRKNAGSEPEREAALAIAGRRESR